MSASPQSHHRPVLDLPGSRNLRYSPVTALTALDSRIGTPSLPLSFPPTLAYRCCMLLCFCFSNEFFFCPARVNCDTVSRGGGIQMKGATTLLILAAALLFTGAATAQVPVLSHATVIDGTASEALGIDKDFGTLAKGKTADLLVLEKNPLENITNMRSIQTIYLGGRKF